MHVPEHISGTGEVFPFNESEGLAQQSQKRKSVLLERMEVPDRITIAGNEGYQAMTSFADYNLRTGANTIPKANFVMDVPSTLTLNEAVYREVANMERPDPEDSPTSQNSLIVDDNPIEEIKRMRRQLGGLVVRLTDLEEKMDASKKMDKLCWATFFVSAAVATIFLIFKR